MTREEILRQQLQAEQSETARELAGILRLTQEMGRRLCNETHGELYDEVRMLMSLLHQTRAQVDLINAKLNSDDPVDYLLNRRSTEQTSRHKMPGTF